MELATDITLGHALPARLPKGFRLEGYVVDGWLRDGGMAAIYRARRISDDQRVALKLQLPSSAHDPAMQERFDREAEVMRRAGGSAHVVELFDAGVLDDGRRWMMMEWVEGEDLEELLDFLRNQDQRLSIARACRIGRDVARGLAELHEHGVVHLDLKPANVMVGRRDDGGDAIELVDFGIAADLRHEAATGGPRPAEAVLGTSGYMAPEQVTGAPSHPSFDLYAWGVLMFEALSGSCVPPDGWSPETLPKVETLRRGVPQELAALVRACMEADPRRRPASAAEVAGALVRILRRLEAREGRGDGVVRSGVSADDVPVRTGGTALVPRSGVMVAAGARRESGALAMRESGEVPVRASGEVPLRGSGERSVGGRAEASVRTGATEVALTHEQVLRSSGMVPLLTTEMVADAMDRLAAQEEAEAEQRAARKRGRRRWGVGAAAAVLLLGGVWLGSSGGGGSAAEEGGEALAVASGRELPASRPAIDTEARDEALEAEPAAVPSATIPTTAEAGAAKDGEVLAAAATTDDGEAPPSRPASSKGGKTTRGSGPSEEACTSMRIAALSAKSLRHWQKVLQATSQRSCWSSPSQRLERTRLRVEAFAEEGEYQKCVKEGRKSRDGETTARVGLCRKRVGGG